VDAEWRLRLGHQWTTAGSKTQDDPGARSRTRIETERVKELEKKEEQRSWGQGPIERGAGQSHRNVGGEWRKGWNVEWPGRVAAPKGELTLTD